jgi:translation initiation factor 3 subunit L
MAAHSPAKSNILAYFSPSEEKSSFSSHPLYRSLGYFSLVGLLRVHTLLGDYHLALQTISPIALNKKGLYTKVIACYITLYYYTGFVYMMMRRFVDAIRTFAHILQYISRIKQFHTKSYQYDAVRLV